MLRVEPGWATSSEDAGLFFSSVSVQPCHAERSEASLCGLERDASLRSA